LEQAAGRSVERRLLPMQPGEVASTFADIRRAREELGFEPRTALGEGAPQFIEWLRAYRAGRS
jgi:UDP-glucuronate 4-epimerase